MKKYEKHIVAFLDILGFKNLIKEKGFEEIKNIFLTVISPEDVVIALSRACDDKDKQLIRYNKAISKAKIHIMSDSIVVAVPAINKESLAVVIDICACIQEQLYSLDTPVLLRGAVAQGDFYIKDGIMFGEALVDAYIAQENYARYPRIIVSDQLIENMVSSVDKEYNVLPIAPDRYRYVNSLERYIGCNDIGNYEELKECPQYKKIKRLINEQLKQYNSASIREKYIWLQDVALKNIEQEIGLKSGTLIL